MRIQVLLPSLALATALAGCVAGPSPYDRPRYDAVPPAPAPRMAELIVYPARGQTAEQTDRDRYECHTWAVRETRFDPSRMAPVEYSPPRERPNAPPAPPPGSGMALGAVTGAVLGAIIAPRGDEGGGAALGAIAGAIVGGVSEQAQADAAHEDAARYDNRLAARQGGDAAGAGGYRRAISACLEARGYTVR